MTAPVRAAERLEVWGIVQGVGFRPFVHRLAAELGLDGTVANDAARVVIEVGGAAEAIDRFAERLLAEPPPLARIDRVTRRQLGERMVKAGFRIVASSRAGGARTLVPPDTAVCDDCLAELHDPADRRFGHPFITCTNCGPRFTIITDLPYDRPATTMAGFPLCAACRAEYDDPADRRYHAQPLCCHDCGPTLWFRWASHPGGAAVATPAVGADTGTPAGEPDPGASVGVEAIDAAVAALAGGHVVAIKGLGGYHLACDATNAAAVAGLRARKHRPDKPFAVMVATAAEAQVLARFDDAALAQLGSPARPVVLATARLGHPLSDLVAPGNPLLGVMLAYTPVHHLVLARLGRPLVMTSANLAGEPIAHRPDQLEVLLGPVADAVLDHDRPIEIPCDDSVVRVLDGALLPVRRARGYAPIPVAVPGARRTVLAAGAELKNTCAVASTSHVWVSQHLGDMGTLATTTAAAATVQRFETMYAVTPEVVAVDTHPGYTSSMVGRRLAAARGLPVIEVQHHHAHIASVMAEHGLRPDVPVLGFAFDGTGDGDDGTIWGGEALVATAHDAARVAHLAPVPLPGGDAAVTHPARVALAHLHAAGIAWDDDLAPVRAVAETERTLLARMLATGLQCVATTSMGRLFDAVASLLDLRHRITYEAQAAIDLEHLAAGATTTRHYDFGLGDPAIDPGPVLSAIVADQRAGVDAAAIANGFHGAVVRLVVAVTERVAAAGGPTTVALSGGVFQNALLTGRTLAALRARGFDARTNQIVPPNDGGIALGQAYIAAHRRAGAIPPSDKET